MGVPAIELVQGVAATPALLDAMLLPLIAYNDQAHGPAHYLEMALVVRGADGAVAGGLWGECQFDWMFVRLLVVPEGMRRAGVGTALMQKAEAFARERGLAGLWLDTFNVQARDFYETLGFTCFGTLDDHPLGGARHFMWKRLE